MKALKHKIKTTENSVLEKNKNDVEKPKLHHDLLMIEDELKPEFDVLNKLVKLVTTSKTNLEKMATENAELKSSNDVLKAKLLGEPLPFSNVFVYVNFYYFAIYSNLELQQNSQNLNVDKQQLNNSKLPENYRRDVDSQLCECFTIENCDNVSRNLVTGILSHLVSDANSNQIFF